MWTSLSGGTRQGILLTFENALFIRCYCGCKGEFLTTSPSFTHSLAALNSSSSLLLANRSAMRPCEFNLWAVKGLRS